LSGGRRHRPCRPMAPGAFWAGTGAVRGTCWSARLKMILNMPTVILSPWVRKKQVWCPRQDSNLRHRLRRPGPGMRSRVRARLARDSARSRRPCALSGDPWFVPRSVPRREHLTAAESQSPRSFALPPADHVEDTQRADLRWEASGVTEPDEPALQRFVVLPGVLCAAAPTARGPVPVTAATTECQRHVRCFVPGPRREPRRVGRGATVST